jgi:hypothetical protein
MTTDAEAVVQRQLDAYNARDLERFLAEYADDVRAYRPPAVEPALAGKQAFVDFYSTQLVNRMVLGGKVIDHERITGVRPEPFEVAVVYEVAGGLIRQTWTYPAT